MPNLTKAEKAEIRKAAAIKAAETRKRNAAQADAKPETAQADAPKADADKAQAAALTRIARGLARDASGIERGATNFERESNRDDAYTGFFAAIARKLGRDTLTLAEIYASGVTRDGKPSRNPFYTGSAKSTDVGAINRQRSAGRVTTTGSGDAMRVTLTDHAKSLAVYKRFTL